MKKFIKKIINRIRGKRELNVVLSSLSKPLQQLEELQEQHTEAIKVQTEHIAKLTADNEQKTKEKERAAKVHSNISTLLAIE